MYFCILLCIILFFNVTATTEIYTYLHTLSLSDALPISPVRGRDAGDVGVGLARVRAGTGAVGTSGRRGDAVRALVQAVAACRVRDVRRGAAGAAVVAGLVGGHRVRYGGGLVAGGAGPARAVRPRLWRGSRAGGPARALYGKGSGR